MINLNNAQLEAFRGLHYFHENLNIHIKSSTAGVILLSSAAEDSSNPRHIGELIKDSHPVWNTPPVHQLNINIYRQLYCSVGAYALVSLFSALDDFLIGIEADIFRFEAKGNSVKRRKKTDEEVKKDSENSDDDLAPEPIEKFYGRYFWPTADIDKYFPVIKYFRLMRNCIAHRSSRASSALSDHSKNKIFQQSIKSLLDSTKDNAQEYKLEQEIFVDPALAICCSDVIRKIAVDCNKRLIGLIGLKGFMEIVCKNLEDPRKILVGAYKTPEALLNLALIERYRVVLNDKTAAPKELRNLGLWKHFQQTFIKNKAVRDVVHLKKKGLIKMDLENKKRKPPSAKSVNKQGSRRVQN